MAAMTTAWQAQMPKPLSKDAVLTARNGYRFTIRPICPDDEQRMIRFHRGLSERSVYMRYFTSLSLGSRTAHSRLARICYADPQRETVLVAVAADGFAGEQILAVGRLSKLADSSHAELAMLVLDEFQRQGLGTELLRRLIEAARNQQIKSLEAEMLRDNTTMQTLSKKFGFHLRFTDLRSVRALLTL